jgi:hypothetical protein
VAAGGLEPEKKAPKAIKIPNIFIDSQRNPQ